MTLRTRPLTGIPGWPITLLAGVPKAGKTYTAIAASASPLIHRTFLITLGETQPEEYAAIPGQRAEVVEHEGSHRDVLRAVREASAEPGADGKPNLLILDSATAVWKLESDMAQRAANARRDRKAQGRSGGDDEARVTVDLWNLATERWYAIVNALRAHPGPVVITARLNQVTVMTEGGEPTKDKTWEVKAQKYLPGEVDAVIELREPALPGEASTASLRGVRSLSFRPDPGAKHGEATFSNGLSMDELWTGMGLDRSVGEREYAGAQVHDDGLLSEEQVVEAIQRAGGARASAADLEAVGNALGGPDALAQVSVTSGERTLSAAVVLRDLIFAARSREVGERAPAAPDVSGSPQSAPVVERAVERSPQAAAEDRRVAERAQTEDRRVRERVAHLVGEFQNVLVPLVDGIYPAATALLDEQGAEELEEVDPKALRRLVFTHRGHAIAALREAGRATEADAYAAAREGNRIEPWERLLGHDVREMSLPA